MSYTTSRIMPYTMLIPQKARAAGFISYKSITTNITFLAKMQALELVRLSGISYSGLAFVIVNKSDA